jgi:3-oxoadipate enol-lactonase
VPTTTTRDGVRLHWDEAGSGTPVLLVMGAGYSSAMWYPVIPALAASHRVVWFDNRGTGGSEATDVASIADMAADARAVLDAAGIERAHVYGVSLGGVVTQQLAIESPERVLSLVLGCTGVLDDAKPRAPKWLDVRFRLPQRLLRGIARRRAYGPACPPERVAEDEAVLAAQPPSQLRALRAQSDALRAYSVAPAQVAALDVPALVLHGTHDTVVPLVWGRELAEVLPQARLVTYEGSGHNYLVAARDEANAEVLAFLAEVDRVAVA